MVNLSKVEMAETQFDHLAAYRCIVRFAMGVRRLVGLRDLKSVLQCHSNGHFDPNETAYLEATHSFDKNLKNIMLKVQAVGSGADIAASLYQGIVYFDSVNLDNIKVINKKITGLVIFRVSLPTLSRAIRLD